MMKFLAVPLLGLSLVAAPLFAERFPAPGWKEAPDPDASPYAEPGGRLVLAMNNFPRSLNAYLSNSTDTVMIFSLLYPTMLALDSRTGEYGPSLADWWEISDDKKLYTFHIDERATWSDGSPITAHDVKATFDTVMHDRSRTGSYKVGFSSLGSPYIIDDRTIAFPCTEVHWRNLGVVGGGLYIMPKKMLDAYKERCEREGRAERSFYFNEINFYNEFYADFSLDGKGQQLVGGPYSVKECKEERLFMILKRNADWWGFKTPAGQGVYNFDEIHFRFFKDPNNAFEAFELGEVDVYAVYSASMWATKSVGEKYEKNWIVKQNVRNHEPIGFQGLAFNMRKPPYDDIRIRKAIAHLFDRRRMVRDLMYDAYFMQQSYCTDLYTAEHPCNTPMFEFDPAEAKRLFKEAGYEINPKTGKLERDGKPFVLKILTRSPTDRVYLAIFKETLDAMGIELVIDQIDFATWMRRTGQYDFEVTTSAFSGSIFRDPEAMWSSRYVDEPNGANLPGFKNARVDELIEQQRTEFSVAKRNEIMREIDALATAEVPNVLTWGVNSTRILYWNKFGTPNSILGKYGDEMSIPMYWWYDPDSARELKQARANDAPLPGRVYEINYDEVTEFAQ